MARGAAPFHIDRKGCHVTLENVRAWVCGQCGEAYFEEQEVQGIQQLIHSIGENMAKLVTPLSE